MNFLHLKGLAQFQVPCLPVLWARGWISAVRIGFPGNSGPCPKITGHHPELPRNAGNVNQSLTQTGALPHRALHLLTSLQNSLWKVPLPSAPAGVCHLPSPQTWWPQPNLDALIPRAFNGWCQKGTWLISPSALLCYPWQALEAGKRAVSLPLSSSPATKYILTGTSILYAKAWRFALQIADRGNTLPLGAETEASSLVRAMGRETHFVVKLSAEERKEWGGLDQSPSEWHKGYWFFIY